MMVWMELGSRSLAERMDALTPQDDAREDFFKLHELPQGQNASQIGATLLTPFASYLSLVYAAKEGQYVAGIAPERVGKLVSRDLRPFYDRLCEEDPDAAIVVNRCFFGRQPQKAVAKRLGVAPSTVHRRLNRGITLFEEWAAL